MRQNYAPWNVDYSGFSATASFDDQLKFLLRFAVLAPSSHNSQPWAFRVRERAIEVWAEPRRRLRVSDANDRELFLSLGCAITNIAVAADYCGYAAKIQYVPNVHEPDLAAVISFSGNAKPRHDSTHLIHAIPERANNRNPYEERMPPAAFLTEIKSLATPDLAIAAVSDEAERRALADTAIRAGVAAMEDKGFRRELSEYVKTNMTTSPVGMPAFGMGIPTPVSLLVPFLIRRFNMSRANRTKDEALLVQRTPVFVVMSTKTDDKKSWLCAGEVYEHIALLAARERLATGVWASPIQIGEFYREFQKILKTSFRPQMFFRLGYPTKPTRHSPRLSANEVMRG